MTVVDSAFPRDYEDIREYYTTFDDAVKRYYGINEKAHIRYREDGHSGKRSLIYLVRRSEPSRGFRVGNFAIDKSTLLWMSCQPLEVIGKLPAPDSERLIALLEKDDTLINIDEADAVFSFLENVRAYTGNGGQEYYWVNRNFQPITSGSTERTTRPPF